MNILDELRRRFAQAAPESADPREFAQAVRPSHDAKFGDYQANGCMAVAKRQKLNPRDVASEVAGHVDLTPLAGPPEIAGPGFLNVRLHDTWLADQVQSLVGDPALGLSRPAHVKTVIVDYSSPNVAKPMHVGHIRSTVIGDALARIYRTLGHRVIRDNHLGDWGTQFGMILHGYKTMRDDQAYRDRPVDELARLYREVARLSKEDPKIAEASRQETAKLHAGDEENRRLWNEFMPHCLAALKSIYQRLGVEFDTYQGEAFYDPMLPEVVADLEAKGLCEPSDGATVVFSDVSKAPFIVRKTDGAYTYATSDLATVRYRAENQRPDLVLYVVDTRQGEHFRLLFDVAKRWGYDQAELVHVGFGTIMGQDRKPFKTRSGDIVGLESLLDDAIGSARRVVDEKSSELPEAERAAIAQVVGISSIKYADLNQNRLSDYVFDLDRFVDTEGNTAAYLLYSYARIQSIFRRGEVDPDSLADQSARIVLEKPTERAIALTLVRFPEILEAAAQDYKPHILTDYLFNLANGLASFYDECPVLKAEENLRVSRLALIQTVGRTLAKGLDLLGIPVLDRM